MNNFKNISKEELISKTHLLVGEERIIVTRVLHHLREIDRRTLYLELGYSSLFKMCVKEFRYSENSAFRRIAAMRLLRDLPEIESLVESGTLTLATVAQAQTHFRANPVSREQKLEVMKSLEGKSKREVEKLFAPTQVNVSLEVESAVTKNETELKLILPDGLGEKLKKLQSLSGKETYADLLDWMATQSLKQLKVEAKVAAEKNEGATSSPLFPGKVNAHSRHIPEKLRQHLRVKAEGQCQFVSRKTGRRCSKKSHLQIDHIQPFALF